MNKLKAWSAMLLIFIGLQQMVIAQEMRVGTGERLTLIGPETYLFTEVKVEANSGPVRMGMSARVEGKDEWKDVKGVGGLFFEAWAGGIGLGVKAENIWETPEVYEGVKGGQVEVYLCLGGQWR